MALLRSEIPSSKCAKLRTVAASNSRDHAPQSLYYCLFAPRLCGVVLRAHPVRGESHIQRNANGEVATVRTCIFSLLVLLATLIQVPHDINFQINKVQRQLRQLRVVEWQIASCFQVVKIWETTGKAVFISWSCLWHPVFKYCTAGWIICTSSNREILQIVVKIFNEHVQLSFEK